VVHPPTLVEGSSAWGQLCEQTNITNTITSGKVTHVTEKYHLHISVQKFEVKALQKDMQNNNNKGPTVKYAEYYENKFKKRKTCASIFTAMFSHCYSIIPVFLPFLYYYVRKFHTTQTLHKQSKTDMIQLIHHSEAVPEQDSSQTNPV